MLRGWIKQNMSPANPIEVECKPVPPVGSNWIEPQDSKNCFGPQRRVNDYRASPKVRLAKRHAGSILLETPNCVLQESASSGLFFFRGRQGTSCCLLTKAQIQASNFFARMGRLLHSGLQTAKVLPMFNPLLSPQEPQVMARTHQDWKTFHPGMKEDCWRGCKKIHLGR